MQMTLLLHLSIFGREHFNLRGYEIFERTKRGIVVHIATRERMVEIITLTLMCACDCEHNFINYTCGGKFLLRRMDGNLLDI